jgi:hypothetical protein
MNAHQTVATLFALARNLGRASKSHAPGTPDQEATETAAVRCAKLGLELEHAYQLGAPPHPHARVCPLCHGARVVDQGNGALVERCLFCDGAGFLRVLAGALVVACLALLVGCGGAEFFPVDPFAHVVDASGSDPVGDAAVTAPGVDADVEIELEAAAPSAPDAEDPHPVMTTAEAGAPDAEDPHPVMTTADVGAPEAAPPPLCEPQTCPACPSPSSACCTSATSCGCENPSEGGQCR